MLGGVKVLGGVPVGRVIATADVTAGAAEPQMHPGRSRLQAFLAPACAGGHVADAAQMRASLGRASLGHVTLLAGGPLTPARTRSSPPSPAAGQRRCGPSGSWPGSSPAPAAPRRAGGRAP